MAQSQVYIGTSGFFYKHWLTSFYPAGIDRQDLLKYYAQIFNTVEINASFYRNPTLKTTTNWRETTPENFIFTFKMSKMVSHLKKLIVNESLDKFFSVLAPFARGKKHVIITQLPGNFTCNKTRLNDYLKALPPTFRYAFEFRSPSWFCPEIYQILKKYNAALVLNDAPLKNGQPLWPKEDVDTADFFYIRFHGPKQLYASPYSDKQLGQYAEIIKTKLKQKQDIFCYFNNDIGGHATQNAKTLQKLVGVKHA